MENIKNVLHSKCDKNDKHTHHKAMVEAEHVCLLVQGQHAVKVCDYEDCGRQSHQGADQHTAPQGTIENLLTHQQ